MASASPTTPSVAPHADGEVNIIVNGSQFGGWEDVSVTMQAEAFPNSFAIRASLAPTVTVLPQAGDDCVITIGSDTVITGFIDRDSQSIDPNGHTIALTGRGATGDLVDCSAQWPSGQLTNVTALDVAKKVAGAYNVAARLAQGADDGPVVVQINLNYGESAAELIQRFARNAGLLAYEDTDGALVLDTVGSTTAASGVVYDQNVEAAEYSNSLDQRYAIIKCAANSINTLGGVAGPNGANTTDDSFFFYSAQDLGVERPRLLYLPMQDAPDPRLFTEKVARWEIAKRIGRSTPVAVTVDSWRDSAGKLWRPNTLIPVELPGLRVPSPLCLSEVTFHRSNERGTVADLKLFPKSAFTPEPITLATVNLNGVTGPPSTSTTSPGALTQ